MSTVVKKKKATPGIGGVVGIEAEIPSFCRRIYSVKHLIETERAIMRTRQDEQSQNCSFDSLLSFVRKRMCARNIHRERNEQRESMAQARALN